LERGRRDGPGSVCRGPVRWGGTLPELTENKLSELDAQPLDFLTTEVRAAAPGRGASGNFC
jgi:hypothetical protein